MFRVMSYGMQVTILTSCVYCTSNEFLLAYELRVTVYYTSYELLLLNELRFSARVTSYFLTISYSEDKHVNAVMVISL